LAFVAATGVAALAPVSSHFTLQTAAGLGFAHDAALVADVSPLGLTNSPLLTSPITDYSWSGGDPVQMLRWNEGFCWLTSMGGNFRGFGESVAVEVFGDSWFLSGQNNFQPSVHGSASCVRYSAFQNIVNQWTFTNPAISDAANFYQGTGFFPVAQLWENHSFCYLGRISGQFNGFREDARIFFDNGWYNLTADTGAPYGDGVAAEARCIYLGQRNNAFTNPANPTLDFEWKQGDPLLQMLPADQGICYLTRVAGDFRGPEEEVDAQVLGRSFTSAGDWYLYGTSVKHDVAASARCTYFLQF
jgi:hypothetical protein